MARPPVGLNLLNILSWQVKGRRRVAFLFWSKSVWAELYFMAEHSLFLQVCLWLLKHWYRLSNAPSQSYFFLLQNTSVKDWPVMLETSIWARKRKSLMAVYGNGKNLGTNLSELLVTQHTNEGVFYSYSCWHVGQKVSGTCLHLVGETLQQIDGWWLRGPMKHPQISHPRLLWFLLFH